MKKLFFTLVFITFNGICMANTIADKDITDELKLSDDAVACCTVGSETACGLANEPLCDIARRAYCELNINNCTSKVRKSVGLN